MEGAPDAICGSPSAFGATDAQRLQRRESFAPATTMRYVNSRYLVPLSGSPKDLIGHIIHPLEVVSTLHSSSEPWTRI